MNSKPQWQGHHWLACWPRVFSEGKKTHKLTEKEKFSSFPKLLYNLNYIPNVLFQVQPMIAPHINQTMLVLTWLTLKIQEVWQIWQRDIISFHCRNQFSRLTVKGFTLFLSELLYYTLSKTEFRKLTA